MLKGAPGTLATIPNLTNSYSRDHEPTDSKVQSDIEDQIKSPKILKNHSKIKSEELQKYDQNKK